MSLTLDNGRLLLAADSRKVMLSLHHWSDGSWREFGLQERDGVYYGSRDGVDANLSISALGEEYAYSLSFCAERPTRVLLRLDVPEAEDVFHLVTGCIFGDNNLVSSFGRCPHLTAQSPDDPTCSPTWELRADSASLPLSMIYTRGLVVGAAIQTYSEGEPLESSTPDGFIRNGLFAAVAHEGAPDACGVVVGHARLPHILMEKVLTPDHHHSLGATASGRIYLLPATSRVAAHEVVRREYQHCRDLPQPPISRDEAVDALLNAFVTVNWHDESGTNTLGDRPPRMSEFFGGVDVRSNFTNMRCNDAEKKELRAWRTLCEIGWSGGAAIADPVLRAGHQHGNDKAVASAVEVLDRIADGINPASGLLWDVIGKDEGKRLNWWWSGYMVQDCHCAYTNGNAAWHLLKAFDYAREQGLVANEKWLATACSVLDTILELQLPDGNFGYTYAADRKAILDSDGYAGCWFVAALALAHQLTGSPEYLAAAQRGAEFYHACTAELMCYGAPMDQHKWPDQEGNLALIRALPLLHQITCNDGYLKMLEDAANYEYLWRYGQRTRPESPPLNDPRWNSCGGSTSGVFTWQHPMGMFVNADLLYLAEQTGDDYHRHRAEDGHNWGINTVSIYPDLTEYGIRGVMTECYCQSGPRPNEFNADGTPATLWHSYNGWAAAATLEGLLEAE